MIRGRHKILIFPVYNLLCLKLHVCKIHVKQIRVNQGIGVMCLIFFHLENGLKPEEPIESENPSKNYLEFSETEVVENDCRDGCKNKAYFHDNGQMAIRTQGNVH